MSKSAPYLEVTGLTCQRGDHLVFRDIGLTLSPGEAVLLSGPNGAGKTSLLMCLAGIVPALAGKIAWPGRNGELRPGTDMHFIAHAPAIKPGLKVAENLRFWAEMHGGDAARVPEALETAGLAHAHDLEAGLLSAGQTRRLALSRLLVAHRPVWLLDEPTAALDAEGSHWIAALLDNHLREGGMVVAATHLDIALRSQPVTTLRLGGEF